MHDRSILSRPVPVRDWRADPPAGTLRALYLHWTAGDYATVYPAYNYCLSGADEVFVHATHDVRANARDVRSGGGAYAAHTAGRNSFAAGIAICAMHAATPQAFAAHPVTEAQIEALCLVSARLLEAYGIPIGAVRTHAEAAVDDGYFGATGTHDRWDIARLQPSPERLDQREAFAIGTQLRTRIAARC